MDGRHSGAAQHGSHTVHTATHPHPPRAQHRSNAVGLSLWHALVVDFTEQPDRHDDESAAKQQRQVAHTTQQHTTAHTAHAHTRTRAHTLTLRHTDRARPSQEGLKTSQLHLPSTAGRQSSTALRRAAPISLGRPRPPTRRAGTAAATWLALGAGRSGGRASSFRASISFTDSLAVSSRSPPAAVQGHGCGDMLLAAPAHRSCRLPRAGWSWRAHDGHRRESSCTLKIDSSSSTVSGGRGTILREA